MSQITLPGLIDMHVHLRDPGQTHKEDFYTGSSAALSGGFTTIFDMPNNAEPITTKGRLEKKISEAKKKTVCDIGFYFGSLGDNIQEFEKVKDLVWGIKLYLNHTTGNYIINKEILDSVFASWPQEKLILVHAEKNVISDVINTCRKYKKRVHVCHVSSEQEVAPILKAKKEGLPVTCGTTPHYLYLTDEDVKILGPYGKVKPYLKTKKDQEFLWRNIDKIDVIESDHAPHLKKEKEADDPPFGMTGLETTLPLLLTAVHEKRLTVDDIIRLCYTNPAKILGLNLDKETTVVVNLDVEYEIRGENLLTKCKTTPFEGKKVRGKVEEVHIEGEKVFENGEVLAEKGSGNVIYP